MASQMVVAPSKDTIFMRGFSSRRDVEDVRDFFEKESRGKVMIEFLKQTEQDDRLFVALRFETKEIAREIMGRFDNTEVLGDKITLTWFKDLRRARFNYKDRQDNRRQRYDNYENYGYNRYGGNNRNRMDSRHRNRPSRRYSRSPSRSVSRSKSRSHSRDRDRDRERDRDRDRRASTRSHSPQPRHRLKSEVQTASRRSKADDSDTERSSPIKEHTPSPERAYSSEPPSPTDTKEYSPAPPQKRGDSKTPSQQRQDRKNSSKERRSIAKEDNDDEADDIPNRYSNRESLSESYEDDKYSSRQQQTRTQQQSRYSTELDERALMEGRWGRNDPSPSRMSDALDRMSTASLERDRAVLASNIQSLVSRQMDTDSMEHKAGRSASSTGPVRMEQEETTRRRAGNFEFESGNAWDSSRRADSFYDNLDERKTPSSGAMSNKLGVGSGDPDRWLGMDPAAGRWSGKEGLGASLGWNPQVMQLIQEKKEDIEKVYKNDCETFVSVVKMLISKDAQLEDRLQHSLRENLKEIGQRCILELREFIDRLKEKEDGPVGGPPLGVI